MKQNDAQKHLVEHQREVMGNKEAHPESAYSAGDLVIPTFGAFKGKTGVILEKAWGESSKEWVYLVKFNRAKHYYYDDEIRRST